MTITWLDALHVHMAVMWLYTLKTMLNILLTVNPGPYLISLTIWGSQAPETSLSWSSKGTHSPSLSFLLRGRSLCASSKREHLTMSAYTSTISNTIDYIGGHGMDGGWGRRGIRRSEVRKLRWVCGKEEEYVRGEEEECVCGGGRCGGRGEGVWGKKQERRRRSKR